LKSEIFLLLFCCSDSCCFFYFYFFVLLSFFIVIISITIYISKHGGGTKIGSVKVADLVGVKKYENY
jgi:membrane associated rhomboid family serine protease